MLRSLEMNLGPTSGVDVWVLDGGVSWLNKRKVVRSLRTGRLRLRWVRVNRNLLKGCPLSGHITLAAYFRLLIPDLLPETVAKVVYLDLDLMVLRDIGELYALEPGKAPVLAIREDDNAIMSTYLRCCREIGIPGDAPYFNSGVLLLNLAVWRAENFSRRLIEFLNLHRDKVAWHDQDAMNALFVGRWVELPLTWNTPDVAWNKSDVSGASILHFKGPIKPWDSGATHGSMFFKYLDETAWKGWRPRSPMRNRHEVSAFFASLPLVGAFWRVSARAFMGACRWLAVLWK